jgi:hypothetical protein
MAREYHLPVSQFLAMHTSYELTELLAAAKLDAEDRVQAELAAKAAAKEAKLRNKRGGRWRGNR